MAAFVRSWERETEVVGRMLDERQSATEIPDGELHSSIFCYSLEPFYSQRVSCFNPSSQCSTTTSISSSR